MSTTALSLARHPNDFDRHRIERVLAGRSRYRYVSPRVLPAEDGYRVESPCCSRTVDPDGGVVDVALLEYQHTRRRWHLFRKNHQLGGWELEYACYDLRDALALLCDDPDRRFWQ